MKTDINSDAQLRVSDVLKRALKSSTLHTEQPLASFVDEQYLKQTIEHLQQAFTPNFLHTFAVKANPYAGVLKLINQFGMGAEVASGAELILAAQAGFTPSQMVFDAPVKTLSEIENCLHQGIALNIDNFQEFERVKSWLKNNKTTSIIGFRINPQIGAGGIALSSTATLTSKFGIGLEDEGIRDHLQNLYTKHEWLNGIHVHVGSVACPLELMAQGVKTTVEFAQHINQAIGQMQIRTIDIGGGLPVQFFDGKPFQDFSSYAKILKDTVPQIFTQEFKILTEFGRSVIAKNAFSVGLVEYTKVVGGRPIAQTHLGAQSLMRIVFQPKEWARPVSVYTAEGEIKVSDVPIEQDIAGPCCFAGDIIAHTRALPKVSAGDWIVVHHTGAYAFSNHFDYNALPQMPVYVFNQVENDFELKQISQGQTIEDVAKRYAE